MKKINQTLKRFGYPDTLIKEYDNWCILLRDQQITLGSLVLVCKDDVTKFSDISKNAFIEYRIVINDIEKRLQDKFKYDKVNYLMLMMVDPNVHFHVIPRYSKSKIFHGISFFDYGWPGIPTLSKYNEVEGTSFKYLKNSLATLFKN
tara:strand:- start:627 stop:1067 length:441 start_codon:yes stop_codon:yes gene_type:complete